MSAHDITLRQSCLVARAQACVTGFEQAGHRFSAEFTRDMLDDLQRGAPSTLYEHWIGQQEARLAVVAREHARQMKGARNG